jgi:serine phosphatase RsbU (regulator of sigma subunit)
LFAYRGGKVSSTLNIVSILPARQVVRLARNNPVPVFIVSPGRTDVLDEASRPVGFYEDTQPVMTDVPIEGDRVIVVATDGLTSAGLRCGQQFDVREALQSLFDDEGGGTNAAALADSLLATAIELDRGRPADDISVLVVSMRTRRAGDEARRLLVRMPLGP